MSDEARELGGPQGNSYVLNLRREFPGIFEIQAGEFIEVLFLKNLSR